MTMKRSMSKRRLGARLGGFSEDVGQQGQRAEGGKAFRQIAQVPQLCKLAVRVGPRPCAAHAKLRAKPRQSSTGWYAPHGRESMGCESPVGESEAMSVGHCRQRHPKGQGRQREVGTEEAGRETRGPDEQKRRSRPASRGEVARHTEPWIRATQVNGAGPVEGSRSYPGRSLGPSALELYSRPGRSPATASEVPEIQQRSSYFAIEAHGRGRPAVMTWEAFEAGKDRISKCRETSVASRGRR